MRKIIVVEIERLEKIIDRMYNDGYELKHITPKQLSIIDYDVKTYLCIFETFPIDISS